jgi:hypothetical protein
MKTASKLTVIAAALFGSPQAHGAQLYTYTSNPLTFDSAKLYGRPYGSESDFPIPSFTASYIIRDDGWISAQSASVSGFDGDYSITPTWYETDSFAFILSPRYHSREDRLTDQHFYFYHDPITDYLETRANVWTYHVGNYLVLGPIETTWANYSNPGQWTVTQVSVVPEPATYGMMLGGLALIGWQARRKRRSEADRKEGRAMQGMLSTA